MTNIYDTKTCTYLAKETCIYDERDQQTWQKRPPDKTRETQQIWPKRPTNMTQVTNKYDKRDQQIGQKRPTNMTRETNKHDTSDPQIWQKRPTNTTKDTQQIWHKRPTNMTQVTRKYDERDLCRKDCCMSGRCTYMTKETYIHDKRDQQTWPKRPINMTWQKYRGCIHTGTQNACARAHTQTYTHAHTHTCILTHTHTHTRTHAYTHTYIHTHKRARTCIHVCDTNRPCVWHVCVCVSCVCVCYVFECDMCVCVCHVCHMGVTYVCVCHVCDTNPPRVWQTHPRCWHDSFICVTTHSSERRRWRSWSWSRPHTGIFLFFSCFFKFAHICAHSFMSHTTRWYVRDYWFSRLSRCSSWSRPYGVAVVSRIDQIIGLVCKRAL